MSNSIHALVTGATGQQGGAVARELIARGHRVRAMTRRPDSGGAIALRLLGAEVVSGDFAEQESIVAAARGVDAVFAMSTFAEAGTDAETRQGKAIVDAAVRARVPHLVYTSVASADRGTGVPHFESKYRVEQHLVASGLTYTIIRPVYFMENATTFGAAALARRTLAVAMSPDTPLQQVSVNDIGRFAALVVEDHDRFAGTAIDIAGDELTGTEAAKLISEAAGVPVRFEEAHIPELLPGLPRETVQDLALMYEFFEHEGLSADLDTLRRYYPEVGWQSFGAWAAAQDWQTIMDPPRRSS